LTNIDAWYVRSFGRSLDHTFLRSMRAAVSSCAHYAARHMATQQTATAWGQAKAIRGDDHPGRYYEGRVEIPGTVSGGGLGPDGMPLPAQKAAWHPR